MSNRIKEQYFVYLDRLRESGITNMFGAGPYLEAAFELEGKEAHKILAEWMKTFAARHSVENNQQKGK